MSDNEKLIRTLKEGLGNPSEVMNLINWDTSLTKSFRLIFLNGLEHDVISYLRNNDCSFSDETLTIDRNVKLIRSYIRYVQSLGLKIDDLFVMSFGSNIHQNWTYISDVSLLLIRDQIKEIAKPFYTQNTDQKNEIHV